MKLLKFKAKNIFSLGDIEVNLKDRGLILVTGHSLDEGSSNGSGKSSIANKGILWTLYGYTAGGLRADDVLNRHGDTKTGWGEIEFIGQDGCTYTVNRGRPSRLDLFKDDVNVSSRKASETQLAINQALGLDYQSFLHTYMFGQGRLHSYASLPPADQKAILEQILPTEQLSIWVDYAKQCTVDLVEADRGLSQSIDLLDSTEITQKKNLYQVHAKTEHWNNAREEKLKEALNDIAVHMEILNDRDSRLAALKDRLAKLPEIDSEIKRLDLQLETLNGEINDLMSHIHLVQERKHQWSAVQSSCLLKHVKIDDGTCPTCNRAMVDSDMIHKINTDNLINSEKALEAAENVLKCTTMLDSLGTTRSDKIEESQKVFSAKMELDAVRKEDTFLRVQIAELTALEDNEEKYVKKAEAIASERNPFVDLEKSLEDDITTILHRRLPLVKHSQKILKEVEYFKHWLSVYGHDIRIKLFDSVCNYLDVQTNQYLKELKNPQLRVQFSTLKKLASGEVKEDFNVRVFSEKGGEGFETLSGGEQQIVSFAIGKALGDLSKTQTKGSSDFQILDEPFSMLDPRNCEALIEFLSKEKGTIMLISNDEHLMNLVPERLHVEKYKGVTSVAQGG